MPKYLRFVIEGLCLGILGTALSFFCNRYTDGFTLSRLDSVFPNEAQWELSFPAEEIGVFEKAINQPFYYLGRGGQCFAFASEDGAYVLKFMNNHWRRPQQWWLSLPWPSALQKSFAKPFQRILRKRDRDFQSYRLAFESLKEESGLLYIHLNKTDYLHTSVKIIDKLQIAHLVDLDTTPFILQKRAKKLYPYIEETMQQGNEAQAKEAIQQVLNLIVKRCKQGIFDEDPKMHANIGILQEESGLQPMFIDIGRFKKDPTRAVPEVYQKDLEVMTKRFRLWLQENYPSLLATLDSA